jgi:hypothetical protein
MSAGAMYLNARQAAAEHRLAAGIAAESGHQRQAGVSTTAAAYHARRADEIRAAFRARPAARSRMPRGYFADAPVSAR